MGGHSTSTSLQNSRRSHAAASKGAELCAVLAKSSSSSSHGWSLLAGEVFLTLFVMNRLRRSLHRLDMDSLAFTKKENFLIVSWHRWCLLRVVSLRRRFSCKRGIFRDPGRAADQRGLFKNFFFWNTGLGIINSGFTGRHCRPSTASERISALMGTGSISGRHINNGGVTREDGCS